MTFTESDIERFWSKVSVKDPEECWDWQAGCFTQGYGVFKVAGKVCHANRIAYALTYSDPGDLFVCHKCDNPKCCNPNHLFLGTQSDNMRDMAHKGRVAGQKLSQSSVLKVRAMLAENVVQRQIAQNFNVTQSEISHIATGKRWRK